MLRKKRFLIGGIIIFLAIGYLSFMGFQSSATYFYTVNEFADLGDSIYGENVRVKGDVVDGSIEQEATGREVKFTITEEGENLLVIYQGIIPDTFKVGAEVVVEGQLDLDGIFQAHTLMPKCPSRYVPIE